MISKIDSKPHHHSGARGKYQSPELLDFVSKLMAQEEPVLRTIRLQTPLQGLPAINIGPAEGKILDFLVRACGAQKAVEVGTLAGYSACWIARALPEGGILHTLENDPKHALVARQNIRRAKLDAKATIHEGPAAETLPILNHLGPFDFCFIDADKVNYPLYLRWARENVRSGGIVVGDNAYFFGKLHLKGEKAGEDAAGAKAMREFLDAMADTRYFASCAMIPTGEGMAMAVRK